VGGASSAAHAAASGLRIRPGAGAFGALRAIIGGTATHPEEESPLSDPSDALAATFVEPRGMVRSIVAATAGREALGMVGGMAAERAANSGTEGSSPIGKGQIASLALSAGELTLFRAKRGAFKPKPTDEMIASSPREQVRSAAVERGRIAGVLEISFADDQSWAFDVPKVHLKGAEEIATLLGAG
jgi:hypothetical protein